MSRSLTSHKTMKPPSSLSNESSTYILDAHAKIVRNAVSKTLSDIFPILFLFWH